MQTVTVHNRPPVLSPPVRNGRYPKYMRPWTTNYKGNVSFGHPLFCWAILPQSTVESPLPMQDTELLLSFC